MAALPLPPHNDVAALRESLRGDRAALEQSFLKHGNAARLLAAHSRLIDRYLRRVWRQLPMPDCIAPAGGGRLWPLQALPQIGYRLADSARCRVRKTLDGTTSHSTRRANNTRQVAG